MEILYGWISLYVGSVDSGLIIKHKMYSIVSQESDLEEWENNKSTREFGNLGKKKKTFLGAIVGPIAAQVGAQLFGGLAYKILGRRRKKKKDFREKQEEK